MNNGGDDLRKSFLDALIGLNQPAPTPPQAPYTSAAGTNALAKLLAGHQTIPQPFTPPQPVRVKPAPLLKFLNPNRIEATVAESQYSNEVASSIRNILGTELPVVKTNSVPKRPDIGLDNGKLVESAVLYIDIRNSTAITDSHNDVVAAKIYKAYLESMVSIARYQGRGHVRGFAGDKIMVIFDNDNDAVYRAVDCAIWMQSFVEQRLSPALQAKYSHPIACGIGIDYGKMIAVRGGIKNNNEIIWAGSPANRASKLADSIPGGEIGISYKAMNRIKDMPLARKRFNLAAAKPRIGLLGSGIGSSHRLAKVRYQL